MSGPGDAAGSAAAGMVDVLRASGPVGRDLLAVDWAATSLGPPRDWPRSLRTVVRVLLTCRFSMWLAWGDDLTFFCNDAYRRGTLGTRYPWALGRCAREVCAEIWPDIGPRIGHVMRTGEATWDEALPLFLERSGSVEETYHTFSCSPLQGDAGTVEGMLCVTSEETERVIGRRRMATLRDLGSGSPAVRGETEVFEASARCLGGNPQDFPFSMVYLFDPSGLTARLVAVTGAEPGQPVAPQVLAPVEGGDGEPIWPLRAAAVGESVLVGDLSGRIAELPRGQWPDPPTQAYLVPLVQQGSATRPYGFLVAGLNPYRAFDAGYRAFVDLVAGRLAPASDGAQPVHARGELHRDTAAASREAARREHRIADELQRSLLPPRSFDPDHLTVATYYRAGVEGTQVGGDWYDVIELGAGRTALVIGDVMGRGVRAAAVMGQLRSAVRAYARLDLPPAETLELCDGLVRDLGPEQIVTCLYAVYDPADRSLIYANAGHLPPLMALPDTGPPGPESRAVRLAGSSGPPLGCGPLELTERRVTLPLGAVIALYTDGLVERRDSDLDTGIDLLAVLLAALPHDRLDEMPAELVSRLLPQGPDDDIAVLLARVPNESPRPTSVQWPMPAELRAVGAARNLVSAMLTGWSIQADRAADIVLLTSELVTNAVLYGRPPIELRLRSTPSHVVLEVYDRTTAPPRRMRPTVDDEHGRGLQLVTLLADRWGTRPTHHGKVVWCMFSLAAPGRAPDQSPGPPRSAR